MHFEMFYDTGGHGGPYCSPNFDLIKARAFDLLRGCPTIHAIEIRPYNSMAIGGYSAHNNASTYVSRYDMIQADLDAKTLASMRASFEYGYKCAEQGLNIQAALAKFDKQMKS